MPLTRERYLKPAYGNTLPKWPQELEAELPAELPDWSQFEWKN